MVETQLSFPAEPTPRIQVQKPGQKPDNASGRDLAPGTDFSAAVAREVAAGNAEDARSREDQPSETVKLDPELDGDEAVAALSQAVAAFVVSASPAGEQANAQTADDASSTAIHASPVAQLRAALPGLAGMASAAAGPQAPGGVEKNVIANPPGHSAAARIEAAAEGEAELVTSGDGTAVGPTNSDPDPQIMSAVPAETFRLAGPAAPVAMLAVARATMALPADDPARTLDAPLLPAADDAAKTAVIGTDTLSLELAPQTGEVLVVTTGTAPGQRRLAAALPETQVESAGTDQGAGSSGIVEGGQAQESMTRLPENTGAVQQAAAKPPQAVVIETERASSADSGEAAPALAETPPSRSRFEIGSLPSNALAASEPAKAQSAVQVQPGPAATIFFAQLPGLAGTPAASPAEQLRPVLPAGGDFTTGAPLRQLEIVLAPPELGTVRVVITREEGEMRVEMIASTSRAVDMLESARESMVEAIRDTGLRTGSIEIRQDLQWQRQTGSGDFANGSAWSGRHEQSRQQGTDNWQAARGHSYVQAARTADSGGQNQGLIL